MTEFIDYFSWVEAMEHCVEDRTEKAEALERLKDAYLKVKSGEAVYQRDSFIFDKIQYSWPLLSGLLWIASLNNSSLNVLDFGGSLGASYYQCLFRRKCPSVPEESVHQFRG
jgi:putative methyltransferase (TIGR04325 family)